jgi:signal transduction histidine kinase/HAMP domain-containing protein
MRISLKAKLTALISVLVLIVVVTISGLYCQGLVENKLDDVASHAQDLTRQVYDQCRETIAEAHMQAGTDPNDPVQLRSFAEQALNNDHGLVSSVQTANAYSQSFEYVTITDNTGYVLLHNDANQVGHHLPPAAPFAVLTKARLYRQIKILYGPPQIYDVNFPLTFGVLPLDVRVGISTVFLDRTLKPELSNAFWASLGAILLSTMTAGLLSFLVLRPLQSISQSVERLARGEAPGPVPVSRSDEWGVLSSKLNLLGERMRGEKAAFVALKDNLTHLLGNLADGLMLFDQQDRLILATPAVARFLARPTAEILRKRPDEIFSGNDALSALLRDAFARRQALSGEAVEAPPDSETGRLTASLTFVEEQGSPIAGLLTLRDAESRAQLESQIDTAAKLAAIGRLTAGVAHEVRNPLNAMILQIEVLKAKLGNQADQVRPNLDVLANEVHRLNRVVKTFLDFARPVELHPVETGVEELIEEVFRAAQPEASKYCVSLVHELNGALTVRIDRDLIKQVLLNLVLNGCQAMPQGGELRISSRAVAHQVEIKVADHGVGIPPEDWPKIFSLYHTTKPSGTGVGLAMSYRIVQLHDGSIDFSSEVSRGTTFRLTLPGGKAHFKAGGTPDGRRNTAAAQALG